MRSTLSTRLVPVTAFAVMEAVVHVPAKGMT